MGCNNRDEKRCHLAFRDGELSKRAQHSPFPEHSVNASDEHNADSGVTIDDHSPGPYVGHSEHRQSGHNKHRHRKRRQGKRSFLEAKDDMVMSCTGTTHKAKTRKCEGFVLQPLDGRMMGQVATGERSKQFAVIHMDEDDKSAIMELEMPAARGSSKSIHIESSGANARVEKAGPVTRGRSKLTALKHAQEHEQPVLLEAQSPFSLPPSSLDILVPKESVLDFLATYNFFRSFSRVLFLSPFSLEEYRNTISSETPTSLMDALHVCLLVVLRRHLERLLKSGSEFARACLRHPDWALIDNITWPSHLLGLLYMHGFLRQIPEKALCVNTEYYKVSVQMKLAVVNFLCDLVLDTEEIRLELALRGLPNVEKYKSQEELEDLLHVELLERKLFRKQHPETEVCNFEQEDLGEGGVVEVEEGGAVELGEVKGDDNVDECVLCGMNGDLICCDGCPAAYHSRCVGVSSSLLPQGDWFCPECMEIKVGGKQLKPVGLRGADFLCRDSYGFFFFTASGYLLVMDSSPSPRIHYYRRDDLPRVLDWLEGGSNYGESVKAILLQHFDLTVNGSSDKSCTDLSTASGEVSSMELSKETSIDCLGVLDDESKFTCVCFENGKQDFHKYINHYSLGDMAATAAASLALTKRATNYELDIFLRAPTVFSWPNKDRKLMELPKERCGWCSTCSNPTDKKTCVLDEAMRLLVGGALRVLNGIMPTNCGSGHLPAIAGYLLHIEDSLSSLLLGLWEDPEFRPRWHDHVQHAQSFQDLKAPLLQLESCMRPVVLTGKWFSGLEDVPPLSLKGFAACSPILNKAQDKAHNNDLDHLMWLPLWKRNKVVQKLFQWHLLPTQLTRKVGRQGGLKKIKGLVYSEGMDAPRRIKRCAWQSRVETAISVSHIALQVRCLDACIRWGDLSARDRDRSKVCVYAKEWRGGVPFYLVGSKRNSERYYDSGVFEEAWLTESEVPLALLREFEQIVRSQCSKHSENVILPRKQSILPEATTRKVHEKQCNLSDSRLKPQSRASNQRTFASVQESLETTIGNTDAIMKHYHNNVQKSFGNSCMIDGVWWKENLADLGGVSSDQILFPGQDILELSSEPKCFICSKHYNGQHLFVRCDFCPLWFHGDALGIRHSNAAEVLKIKCHKCRKKKRPDCPYFSVKE